MLFKTPEAARSTEADGRKRAARDAWSRVRVDGRRVEATLGPGRDRRFVQVPLGPGFPYQGTRVWTVTIAADSGHVPLFDVGGEDSRYLGVRVTPELVP